MPENQKAENLLNLSLNATEAELLASPVLRAGTDADNESWEVIVKFHGNIERIAGGDIQVEILSAGYGIITLPKRYIEALAALEEIEFVEKPKRLYANDAAGNIASCMYGGIGLSNRYRGAGICIAVIDSGLSFEMPAFRNQDGTSRVLFYYDQTQKKEYTKDELDEILLEDEEDEERPTPDRSGHGTSVTAIAAGNGRRADGSIDANLVGAAPLADLIIVKLDTGASSSFPLTTALMRALIIDYMQKDSKLIVNSDDEASKAFVNKFGSGIKLGYNNKKYDYNIEKANITPAETHITFTYENKEYNVTTNLTSKFNVYNYMTSLAILHECGYSLQEIINKTKDLHAPKGRCETHKVNNGYAVIDYAHTPDAVEKVITAYNELKKGKVITIVGCGGDRDPIKRPIMGNIATSLSDYTILTSDNPRTEDPAKIMEDILKGVKSDNYEVELDRKTAIKKGIEMLKPEDILLILGKGHEDYQIIGHTKIHLDDAEEVENWQKEHEVLP